MPMALSGAVAAASARSMRRSRQTISTFSCWWSLLWLLLARPGGGQPPLQTDEIDYWLPEELVEDLIVVYGREIAVAVNSCEAELSRCTVLPLAKEMERRGMQLRSAFNVCPKCVYPAKWCEEYWEVTTEWLSGAEEKCNAVGDWPPTCQLMVMTIERVVKGPFDISVICSLVDPPSKDAEPPTCGRLAQATMQSSETLLDCKNWDHGKCVNHFCELYSIFRFRLRPINLQEEGVANPYPEDFILPGCETVEKYAFSDADCPLREDVNGFCACFCPEVKEGPPPPQITRTAIEKVVTPPGGGVDCRENVDEFLVFGRMGVHECRIRSTCESALCNMLEERRNSGNKHCQSLQLPGLDECTGMKLSQMEAGSLTCPWLQHSGEDGVIECMDGTRCAVRGGIAGYEADTWACCVPDHRGRGRCPRDTPVMCDTICSGNTEYCCRRRGECTPRACSPVLNAKPTMLDAPIFSNTTTLPPTGPPIIEEDTSFFTVLFSYIEVDGALMGWLIFLVPLCCGCCMLANWKKLRRKIEDLEPDHVTFDPSCRIEDDVDKLGPFQRVMKPDPPEEQVSRAEVARIVVRELPETKPLGLALQETMVVKVQPWGAKWGWREGDVILSIAGHKVTSFEQLWDRIQIERDRVPVVFMVRRLGAETVDPDAAAKAAQGNENKSRRGTRRTNTDGSRSTSRTATRTETSFSPSRYASRSEYPTRSEPAFSRSPTRNEMAADSRMGTRSEFVGIESRSATRVEMSSSSATGTFNNSRMPTRTETPSNMRRGVSYDSGFGSSFALGDIEDNGDPVDDPTNAFPCKRCHGPEDAVGYKGPGGVLICNCCRCPIQGPFTQAGVEIFHPQCFCCSSCRRPLEDWYLISDDGRGYLCTDCRPRCAICQESFGDKVPVYVAGERYHVECFKCCDCSAELARTSYHAIDDGFLCQICYAKSLGDETKVAEAEAAVQAAKHVATLDVATGSLPGAVIQLPPEEKKAPKFARQQEVLTPMARSLKAAEARGGDRPWLQRLQAPPRINKMFKAEETVKPPKASRYYKEKGATYVRDAWGRHIIVEKFQKKEEPEEAPAGDAEDAEGEYQDEDYAD
eukprot:TRINITY_DN22880_c0_g2_i1.p1 TRINITY_DN22880_c0_g2~~TRINITY_DN22880_c0_g2_i1.p1  ORF type:complete len:1089 (+),score=157.33 TRINITY_DN22880_c0_g2_i1:106-3372(+)